MAVETDFSSGSMAVPSFSSDMASSPSYTYGSFQRNWLGELLTGTYQKDYEDWLRSEQSADLALQRDYWLQQRANEFSASEAQKQRDYEERLSNTAISRAVADMKNAGINPNLAFSNVGSASTPTGSFASASSARSSGSNYQNSSQSALRVIGSILSLVGDIVAGNYSKAGKVESARIASSRPISNRNVNIYTR